MFFKGLICTIIGIVIMVIHYTKDNWTYRFFAADQTRETEEIYAPIDKNKTLESKISLGRRTSAINDQGVFEELEKGDITLETDDNWQTLEDPDVSFQY